MKSGIGSFIAPNAGFVLPPAEGKSHRWRIPLRASGFWCSKAGSCSGPGGNFGEPWLSYRQAKRPRIQAPKIHSPPPPPHVCETVYSSILFTRNIKHHVRTFQVLSWIGLQENRQIMVHTKIPT